MEQEIVDANLVIAISHIDLDDFLVCRQVVDCVDSIRWMLLLFRSAIVPGESKRDYCPAVCVNLCRHQVLKLLDRHRLSWHTLLPGNLLIWFGTEVPLALAAFELGLRFRLHNLALAGLECQLLL